MEDVIIGTFVKSEFFTLVKVQVVQPKKTNLVMLSHAKISMNKLWVKIDYFVVFCKFPAANDGVLTGTRTPAKLKNS
jgi:predicted CDP-diglyceride synthetase/phosphatidate cytidylyltransferase